MIIDAKNTILGRLAAYAAKQALLGEKVYIVNCEQAIITGSKKSILKKYKEKIQRGHPYHGPFFPKIPDKFVRRIIRGMLPYKIKKGMQAYKNIKCYKSVPEKFKDKKFVKLPETLSKLKVLKYLTIKDLCKELKYKK